MNVKLLGTIGLAVMLTFSACLENLFNSTEEEKPDTTDNSFVGQWYMVTQTVNGIKATYGTIITMNEDGTGIHQTSGESDSFTWNTEDSALNVITGENNSFSASYQFSGNTVTLSYVDNGETYVEKYAKYTGDRNASLVGKWVGVRSTLDGVDKVPAQTVTFGVDGAAIAYYTDSTTIIPQAFTWTTSGNYLLNSLITGDMWTGLEYTLTAPLVAVKEYYDDGKEYISTFIKDSGEKDPALTGTWNLTGLTVNSFPLPSQLIPQGASFTLNAATGTGSFVLDATPVTYSWTTNSGYLLLYPTVALQQIGIGQTYTISGSTLTFSMAFNAKALGYFFGSSPLLATYAASVEYVKAIFTFTKQ